MATRVYNEQAPDGSWRQVTETTDANGKKSWSTTPIDPSNYQSAGITSGSTGGQTYTTSNGPKTIDQMRAELQAAGYNGPTDDASIQAAYARTVSGAGAGGASGTAADASYQKMLDAIASGNQQQFDEAVREFNSTHQLNEQQLYANTAQNLLSDASKLTGPADYYQFQQYASGGRSLMDQLFGNQPRAAFSASQGTNNPLNIQTLMQELGFRTAPDGSSTSASSSGSAQQYQTSDGILTIQQMIDRLKQAGWPNADKNPSDQDVITAYQNTTHTPVTLYTGSSTSTGNTTQSQPQNPLPGGVIDGGKAAYSGTTLSSPQTSSSNTVSPTNYISGGGLKAYGNMSTASGPSGISSGAGTTGTPAQSSGSGVPVYDKGGSIQGSPGQHILALLQSGEKVTPAPSNTPQGQTRFAGDLPAWQIILGHMLGAAGANQRSVPVYDNGGVVRNTSAMQPNIFYPHVTKPDIFYHPVNYNNNWNPDSYNLGNGTNLKNYDWRQPAQQQPNPTDEANAFRQKIANTSPFQVNPAQWDALGTVGQQLVLSAVKAAGWDPTEWQAQLNAQRPTGTAPKQTLMQYYTPANSGNAAPAGVY